MIYKYEKYLNLINKHLLQKFFEQQKDYINCKSGCSFCCEAGEYPFSEVEFQYAMLGYNSLSEEEKGIIQAKIEKVKKTKAEFNKKGFMYECPFLINKKCSIYNYRGIICRTHGLMYFIPDEDTPTKSKCPSCINIGLNYSNIYDKAKNVISVEMWEKTGIETEPVAYNIGLKYLLNNILTEELELEFGEVKALIDWF